MRKGLSFVVIFFVLLMLSSSTMSYSEYNRAGQSEKIIGVKVYDLYDDYNELVTSWIDLGINTAFVSVDLMRDSIFTTVAKKKGIKLFVIFPFYFNPDVLHNDEGLYAIDQYGNKAINEWVEFVCPNRTEYNLNKIKEVVEIVKTYQPDGISLDFIRNFVFWEKVYPDTKSSDLPVTCFCDSCVKLFSDEYKINLLNENQTIPERASCIINNYGKEFTEWKCDKILSIISRVSEAIKTAAPKIKLNVHNVPWGDSDYESAITRVAGQDRKQISKVADYISPMTYSHMIKRDPKWISKHVEEISAGLNCKILPSIQVGKAYLEEELLPEEFELELINALKYPSSGVIFWNWNAIDESVPKKAIIKKVLKENLYGII